MANLLQKASIVLTPTAYDNGKVLCAKPSEPPYGDFDFSRNSAATRVNAQGLVENIQILSSNLVQNGSFSEEGAEEVSNGSFSQEGAEQVINGDFSTDSNWGKSASATISSGVATLTASSSNVYIYQVLWAPNAFTNKTVKVTYTITSNTLDAGVFTINGLGSNDFSLDVIAPQTVGTHSVYIPVLDRAGNDNRFAFLLNSQATSGAILIDNVSVKEVGQDWSLGTGWSIGEDKAISDGSGYSGISQIIPNLIGKIFKVQFDIVDYTSGTIRISPSNKESGSDIRYSNNGTYVEYYTSAQNRLDLQPQLFNGSITNISVKEVGQDWDFSSGAFITDIGARLTHTPTAGTVSSVGYSPLVLGNNYKMTYEITESISGGIKINSAVNPTMVGTVGVHTKYFKADSPSISISRTNSGGNDVTITNISIIEITDDTNLPRINYEGFSYQDALGSELVLNGDFSNGTNDWGITSASYEVSNGELKIYNQTSNPCLASQSVIGLIVGKQYKVSVTSRLGGSGGNVARASFFGNIFASSNGQSVTETIIMTATSTSGTIGLYVYGTSSTEGYFDNVSVKEYLGQEVVPDSGCGSWLWEPQSTNLLTYSEDFGGYSNSNSTDEANATTSPEGLTNATSFLEAATTGQHKLITSVTFDGSSDYTFSIFAKSNGRDLYVDTQNSNKWGGRAWFNLTAGTANAVLGTADIEDFGNGWYRCIVTGASTLAGGNFVELLTSDGAANSTTGDITKGVYIWGAMLENQSYATSYIPTAGTTVTRNQETCINATPEINSEEGTLYFEGSALVNGGTSRIIGLSDGTNDNLIYIRFDLTASRFFGFARGGGGSYTSVLKNGINQTDYSKVALVWNATNLKIWINGSEQDTATINNLPIAINTLDFTSPTGSNNFYGNTKNIQVYPKALSDAELIKLTT